MCRADAALDVSMLQSNTHKATVADIKWYNTLAKRLRQSSCDSYLMYCKLKLPPDKQFCQIVTDSAFKNREDAMSHAAQLVRLCEQSQPGGLGNLIDWSSKKLDRSLCSTYGAELLSHVKGFNQGLGILYLYKDMLYNRSPDVRIDDFNWRQPCLPIATMSVMPTQGISTTTDCRSLWDNVQSNKLPSEANLWPDVTLLKQCFANGTIQDHYWTDTGDMVADAITKKGIDPAKLIKLMHGRWIVDKSWKQAKKPVAIVQP